MVQDDDISTTDDVKAKIEERLALAVDRILHHRFFGETSTWRNAR